MTAKRKVPAKRGTKGKYTPTRVKMILKLLKAGCVVADIQKKVGISNDTYFAWIRRYPDFADAVERAKGEANTYATEVIRAAMAPHAETTTTTKTFSETRLRKGKGGEQVPFTYTKIEEGKSVTLLSGDWRAALEFLKRRDPDNWSEKLIIQIRPEDAAILERAGVSASSAWAAMMQQIAATLDAAKADV